jgi:tRNA(adenine34) deaminase
MLDHSTWMQIALEEAAKAKKKQEVPVGAIVVYENRIIGKGHNLVERLQDPTAHAEMLAITSAANSLASWRLEDTTLFVTLEPCPMCVGAILLSRIPHVVFGAADPRYGACGSALQLANNENIDVSTTVTSGILKQECGQILKDFFVEIRQRNCK